MINRREFFGITAGAGATLPTELPNAHDTKLLAATLDAVIVVRPEPTLDAQQHLCLDKGYDNPTGRPAVADHRYIAHIPRIGEEKLEGAGEKR